MKDLSVIIVSYRTRDRLEECLKAIERSQGLSIEAIVVDNASHDGSVEVVRKRFPWVTAVANRHNYGFAVANNQGYHLSTGRHVMTLNPDAVVSKDTLTTLVHFLDANPAAALAAPAFVRSDLSVEPTRYALTPIEPPQLWRMLGRGAPIRADAPVQIRWIWGTGYVCRRAALEADGCFFQEETFLFGEEYELCKRLRNRGYSLYLVPKATLHHSVSASYRWQADSFAPARKLGVAVVWRMRRREFGLVVAHLNQLVTCVDAATLWLVLTLKGFLKKEKTGDRSLGRSLGRVDYKARFIASIGVLFFGERYVHHADAVAWRYFNGGVRPPLPPEGETYRPMPPKG